MQLYIRPFDICQKSNVCIIANASNTVTPSGISVWYKYISTILSQATRDRLIPFNIIITGCTSEALCDRWQYKIELTLADGSNSVHAPAIFKSISGNQSELSGDYRYFY